MQKLIIFGLTYTFIPTLLAGEIDLDKELHRKAKNAFDKGVVLISENKYGDALRAFHTSYEFAPKALVLYNIAMCQKAMGSYPDAVISFRKYLREAGRNPKPDMREEVEKAIDEISPTIAYIDITSTVPDSTVIVDDNTTLPLPLDAPYPLSPGKHHVEISAPNQQHHKISITIPPGETKVIDITLSVQDNETPPAPKPQPQQPLPQRPQQHPRPAPLSSTKAVEPSASAGQKETIRANPPLILFNILGGVSIAAAAGGLSVGLIFNLKGIRDNRDAEDIGSSFDGNPDTPEYREYEDIRTRRLPKERAFTIGGYTAGAIFLGMGVGLIIYNTQKNRKQAPIERKNRLEMAANGLRYRF